MKNYHAAFFAYLILFTITGFKDLKGQNKSNSQELKWPRSMAGTDTSRIPVGESYCDPGNIKYPQSMADGRLETVFKLIATKTGGDSTSGVILSPCKGIENVTSVMYENKFYFLYNPFFINPDSLEIKTRNDVLVADDRGWKAVAVIAHEYGHFMKGHLTNLKPGVSVREMELEADESCGFIIYLLGGTLKQAKLAFENVSEKESYSHPAKKARLMAVEKGYAKAKSMYKIRK